MIRQKCKKPRTDLFVNGNNTYKLEHVPWAVVGAVCLIIHKNFKNGASGMPGMEGEKEIWARTGVETYPIVASTHSDGHEVYS